MFARGRSKERGSRKVTPPSPSYMTSEQFAAYLAELRNHRVNRPAGARPPPASKFDNATISSSTRSLAGIASPTPPPLPPTHRHQRAQSDADPSASRQSLAGSIRSSYSTQPAGKDYYPDRPVQPLKPSEVVPSATYIERGQRWMEKEEAHSLRRAMEDMDLKDEARKTKAEGEESDEEKRIYDAALNEAAELVWQHQNPGKMPQPGAPYRYRPHLRKNSYAHARTASVGRYGSDVAPTGLARDARSRSASGSSTDGDGPLGRMSFSSLPHVSTPDPEAGAGHNTTREPKPYGDMHSGSFGLRSRSRRANSGEDRKPFSGDQIWEEPDNESSERLAGSVTDDTVRPLQPKPKEPLNRLQSTPRVNAESKTNPYSRSPSPEKMVSRYEIYRNPPTQSRNPEYTTNTPPPTLPARREDVPRKHGMEIRSDEIKQATSMKLKDRSPKLPTPSAVSDSPGRPIVSFDKNWKPQEEATDDKSDVGRSGGGASHPISLTPGGLRRQQTQPQQQQPAPAVPSIAVSDVRASSSPAPSLSKRAQTPLPSIQVDAAPSVPMIAVSDASSSSASPPAIVIEPEGASGGGGGPSIPVIVSPDDNNGSTNSRSGSQRPLPTPQPGGPRVRRPPRAPRPVGSRATALCHECALPLEGRFVSLAGSPERFHPQCFTCYACGTSLEALEISPEPDDHRAARLERIARRAAGEVLPEEPGKTAAEDGDDRLRFFCHLDWHELFAPRCKHCKTPIMGEHVVALGAHWHFGHFFCAECGEPFGKGMTHIEKDGYAWCVSCQTKRTERRAPKCRKCRKAVIGQYIRALGGEWHDECFRSHDH
ncbi:hypothetical protein VTJ49DRAFT_6984 [Mycothermus thermophilus]|uniref:LIM zinc-binding domain-containing protein n=1 Tax=Humicola insolens TaxID=85995 RepID=A0ABR3VHY6_HUMIN